MALAISFFEGSSSSIELGARVSAVELAVGDPKYPDLVAMLHYWQTKRSSKFAPAREDIDPAEVIHALPRLKLVDVFFAIDGQLDFRFRLAGTWIGNTLGTELTRLRPRDLMPPQFGDLIHRHYTLCVEARSPLLHRVQIESPLRFHDYVRILLPLSSDGATVDMLMTIDSSVSIAAS